MRTGACCIGAGWRNLSKLWTVSRSHWCAVLINTFHSNWIWFTHKLLVWSEGHCTIWCNSVCSLTWNVLLFTSIFEAWLNCFVNRNKWITTLEAWATCLRNTLRTCAGRIRTYRCHLGNGRCISSSHFRTVLINTSYCDWCWCTNILFLRSKGDRTI